LGGEFPFARNETSFVSSVQVCFDFWLMMLKRSMLGGNANRQQFFLKFLRKFPGEKTAMKRLFALVVKTPCAKIAPRAVHAAAADLNRRGLAPPILSY
jgi:hypothetical protein